MQLCDVAQAGQNFGHPAWPRRDDIQVHGKSRLTAQMGLRVEKPPACGRFGFGASVLQAASLIRVIAAGDAPGAYGSRSNPEIRPCASQIAALEHRERGASQGALYKRDRSQEQSAALPASVGYGPQQVLAHHSSQPQTHDAPGVT